MLDTTLRDGSQTLGVSFTSNDKVRIALELDRLGVDYIEGGWPGSNPKDKAFFDEIKDHSLGRARIAAFGSTMHKDTIAKYDKNLNAILESGASTAVIFGKSWLLHVSDVLKVRPEENLALIHDSIAYLRQHGLEVIFDAEHFYRGFLNNSSYAKKVIESAIDAGSRCIVLADTNGGTPPSVVEKVTKEIANGSKVMIGLHMHNDMGCAVANTLLGVSAGATHIQGTINGLGERCGNADLVQLLPTLGLKMNYEVLDKGKLKRLQGISDFVYEVSGIHKNPSQPYVGSNAFAHKGGIHADAVLKNATAYEHINPLLLGRERSFVVSEMSGGSSLVGYASALGIALKKSDARLRSALEKIKEMEKDGYSFDLAPESAMLVLMKELGLHKEYVALNSWQVISEGDVNTAIVRVGSILEAAEGPGPVNALDTAIRGAVKKIYPTLSNVRLTDYRVVLPGAIRNTESTVRVTIEFSSNSNTWRTMGVSKNIMQASVKALVDGLNFHLNMEAFMKKK